MAADTNHESVAPAPSTAYRRFLREKGTRRIVVAALALIVLYYVYLTIHYSLMSRVHWPPLKPDLAGLTVVGLQDQPRPGWRPKYKAFEINHAWQIRRPDDEEDSGDTSPEDTEAAKDRGNDPAAGHQVNRGEAVDVQEVLRNCPVVLTTRHFTHADVEQRLEELFDRHYWVVNVYLTDEGRSRYEQFSRVHNKERLAFILGNEIITCPRMDHMDVSMLSIEPIWIQADAQRLADFINHHK